MDTAVLKESSPRSGKQIRKNLSKLKNLNDTNVRAIGGANYNNVNDQVTD
ncbi:MAG: hypothetical protein K2X77_22575 [Candidatus Obscuribacterales bacterium]|jgi:hypothetical protein|nr:hypothetical protein [Candidatus Obscuribacterales bacterium]